MKEDFFKGIPQVELSLPSGDAKWPIFYYDARMFALVLPANLLKLKRMLPDPRFQPAQVMPGVGAIALAGLEYYDTDIGPYNEFAMGIILNTREYAGIPGYNMLMQYFNRFFNVYIYHMPVTEEIALRAGIDYYNYPKFISGVDFSDTESRVTCDVSRDGDQILTMSGEKVATQNLGVMKFICNLYQFRQPQLAEFKLNLVQGNISWMPNNVSWAFNRSNDIGGAWSDLVIGNRAVMYLYMPKIQCILYGPEYIPIPLMRHTILTKGFLPKPAVKKAAAKKKKASP